MGGCPPAEGAGRTTVGSSGGGRSGKLARRGRAEERRGVVGVKRGGSRPKREGGCRAGDDEETSEET